MRFLSCSADEKYMGAKPGIIASLHSWTKTLLVHPHIHCLVTGCGISQSGELKSAVKDFLLPYDLIKDTFRKHARKAILKALNKGELVLPDGMRAQRVENLMNKLGRKKWNVRICERYPHGCGVLTYLARYLKRRSDIKQPDLSKLLIIMRCLTMVAKSVNS